MRNSYSLILMLGAVLIGSSVKAQLYIDGAGFFIQPGATVTVQGNVTNNGTLTNNGNLRVQGDFLNSNQLVSTENAAILEMYGTGNSNLNVGSALLKNLIINKTNATDVVSLTADAQVTQGFTFTQGGFITGTLANPNFILSSPTSATYSFVTGKEVIGNVRRTSWVNGSAAIFNQTNMLVTTNAGTAPTSVTVTMIPNGDPTQAEREVKRKFNFTQTSGSGFTADIRYPYATGELNNNLEGNLVPWKLVATEWNAKMSPVTRDAGQDWVNTTGIAAADFAQEWKLADPNYTMNVTAYLRGAWNSGTQLMNTGLNSGGHLQTNATSQPFNSSYFDSYAGTESVGAGFFSAHPNIVDWILIDFRKPTSGNADEATFINSFGRRAAFITSNGTIVDLDGVTPIKVPITKQGAGFLVLKHRNHLPIMSNSLPSNSNGFYTNDFSAIANIYDNPLILSDPAQALPSSTKFGMWAGNAVKDGIINPSDIAVVKSNANVLLSGYVNGDINFDGIVNPSDIAVTKQAANGAGQSHSGKGISGKNNKEPKNHVPN